MIDEQDEAEHGEQPGRGQHLEQRPHPADPEPVTAADAEVLAGHRGHGGPGDRPGDDREDQQGDGRGQGHDRGVGPGRPDRHHPVGGR
jgi:hypothetical protein